MYKSIYIAASGAITREKELDILTRNIANASTPAYKKERMAFQSFLLPAARGIAIPGRVMTEEAIVVTDYSQGDMITTGDPFDLAIKGDGFFALEGNLYTRKGGFLLDSEGYLVSSEGHRVLGTDGTPLHIGGGRMEVNNRGEISVDGTPLGRLKIVDFPKPYKLVKVGDETFTPSGPISPFEAGSEVLQGMKEGSNVDIIEEMVRMVSLMRQVESYQKMIRAIDESSGKAINEIGRI